MGLLSGERVGRGADEWHHHQVPNRDERPEDVRRVKSQLE